MPTAFGRLVTRTLDAHADPAVKAGAERYFRGALAFRGVRGPTVQRVFRDTRPVLHDSTPDQVLDEALALLRSPYGEDRQVAVLLLHQARRRLPPDTIRRLEPVVDATSRDWATIDGIAGRVLRYLIPRSDAERRRVVAWSRSGNPWRQRASAVAFLAHARAGRHADDILAIGARIVRTPFRFTQLGLGWVLRELWLAHPARMEAFLADHLGEMSAEGLRYAIEKMPAARRARWMARRRALGRTERKA